MTYQEMFHLVDCQIKSKQLDAAITTCLNWLKAHPNTFTPRAMQERSHVFAKLGNLYERHALLNESITAYVNAIHLNPKNEENWLQFAHLIHSTQFHLANDRIKAIITEGLSRKWIDAQHFAMAGRSLIKLMPEFLTYFDAAKQKGLQYFIDRLKDASFWSTMNDDLFLALLKNTIIADQEFENLLTLMRELCLLKVPISMLEEQPVKNLLIALAMQCWYNEYIYQESFEESQRVEQLIHSHTLSDGELILLGCYRKLYTIPGIKKSCADPDFQELLTIQIEEPLKELELKQSIPCLKPICDEVSKKVRQQYEENPYPRWKSIDRTNATSIDNMISKQFPDWQDHIQFSSHPKVLIAGCGTGQHALKSALMYKNSQLLAIDISVSGLAYGQRKAMEYGVENVKWMQADILDLPLLRRHFDVIECSGVLHHMHKPFSGWKILTEMLTTNGLMIIGLYSKFARKDVEQAHTFIKLHGYQPILNDIRNCRAQIFALPDHHPLKSLTQTIDFYSTSACRDLIFHVQEHQFSLLELEKEINRLGLVLIGLEIKDRRLLTRYAEMILEDTKATSLKNWHQFEQIYPQAFIGMYHLWLIKASA